MEYKRGFLYIYNRWLLVPRILKISRTLEKSPTHDDFSIHILTCHRDIVMTLWSLASFFQAAVIIGNLFIHDDGSLTEADKRMLKRFFPSAVLVDSRRFLEQFAAQLDVCPVLKHFRTRYTSFFSFKKIIDPYFVSDKKIHLILDSDILWFNRPEELEREISVGCRKSFMQNNNTAIYATFKGGARSDERLSHMNAGIILYSKDNFDIQKLCEFFERLDVENLSNLHFADQAGHAYCLKNVEALDEQRYIIKGAVGKNTIAKHYTSPRRPLFYIEGVEILKDKILR